MSLLTADAAGSAQEVQFGDLDDEAIAAAERQAEDSLITVVY